MHNNSRGTDYNPVEDVIGDIQLRVADNQSGIEKAETLGLQIIDEPKPSKLQEAIAKKKADIEAKKKNNQ